MPTVTILPSSSIEQDFLPEKYIPTGKDEYYYRNHQNAKSENAWRNLNSKEINQLIKNNNTSSDWNKVYVTNSFDPALIKNSEFFGLVRIGDIRNIFLEYHDLRLAAGITNSTIISCDIGDDCAIHHVRYLSHYIIGNRCILSNIDEMHITNHAKFGNGIIKEGEPEDVRVWLDLMNETGCRKILPFDGIITADAYLWAKYRDDANLQEKLVQITQNTFDSHRGYYGTVGDQCVIKNSLTLKDVKIGEHCYIKGSNKLKNLTINSSQAEATQIGEGVELVNGIIGFGCHIFYGCKAVRFILGNNSSLKYGARLINSFLGDNSTISCCEVLNNLIFPAHEQHHNNSFLISTVVLGQSNLAAGATIGSNHNSRANDNEIRAGRGFWPGLCSSVKHSCRFASFVLLSKAAYPAELDIPLPFSLVNNNEVKGQLEVMPAFWWMYNMYALARNTWKFTNRDKRKNKVQNIEFDSLAPDTIEEIFSALELLELWTGKASIRSKEILKNKSDEELIQIGKELLLGSEDKTKHLEILGENMEKSNRNVIILKVHKAYHAYRDMLHYYAIKNLMEYLNSNSDADFSSMYEALKGRRVKTWVNLGGQLIPAQDVDQLRSDIGSGKLSSWKDIHLRYNRLWKAYPLEKQKHAFSTLCEVLEIDHLSKEHWLFALDKAIIIQEYIRDQVYNSRKKDFDNPFRQATYRNKAEMEAAIGTIEDNSFVKQVRTETENFKNKIKELKKR
jgi:NDP-sugar pyrophosphorylase family protein